MKNTTRPNSPIQYEMVNYFDASDGVSKSKHRNNIKKILIDDARKDPKFFDNSIPHGLAASIPGAMLGGLLGGKRGVAIGGAITGVAGGMGLNSIAHKIDKISVKRAKHMLKLKNIDSIIDNEYKKELNFLKEGHRGSKSRGKYA